MRVALDPAMLAREPIEVAFQAAADAGYRSVELGNRDDLIGAFKAVAGEPRDLADVRRAAASAGVGIASVAVIQAWSSPDEEVRERAVAWWRDGIGAALALGCRRINTELSGDPGRPAECRSALMRSLETILPVLEREGLEVAVEPHPGDFAETTAEAIDLVRAVGSERLRYLHCVPHTFYLGGSVAEQLETAGGWFDHVHVADTFRPERTIVNPSGTGARIHQHWDIGSGEIAWDEVVRGLRAVGFDGLLTVQVFGWADRAGESFRANRLALERLFADP